MDRVLTSKKGERVIALKRLAEKPAERREQGLYLVDGLKLVSDALAAGVGLKSLLLSPAKAESPLGLELASQAKAKGVEFLVAEEKVMRHISDSASTQGVLALAKMQTLKSAKPPTLALSLHGVQDPGNVGAILRSAAAVGVDLVLLDNDCADPYSLRAVRASAGAVWQTPLELSRNMEKSLENLKKEGFRLGAAVAEGGKNYLDEKLLDPYCLMIGAEGQGLPLKIKGFADFSVCIRYPGAMESLNASISASIILFETLRQRKTL